jgi:hydroxymethylglutaryl-CoA lyase
MQGLETFIPTETKAAYINQLLQVGFDTIDFGSFVSPKAIPQLADTREVLSRLNTQTGKSKLLAIVANTRGAAEACTFEAIHYLGFPLSVSETFQQRNTNKSIAEAMVVVAEIQAMCQRHQKEVVVYLSMGFGNPYGDPYSSEVVAHLAAQLHTLGIKIISLADTVGLSTPDLIGNLFAPLAREFPDIEWGVHLHSAAATAREKIVAALTAGCQRFDGALLGYGGCPMAEDELVGNVATEVIVEVLSERGCQPGLDMAALAEAARLAQNVFLVH